MLLTISILEEEDEGNPKRSRTGRAGLLTTSVRVWRDLGLAQKWLPLLRLDERLFDCVLAARSREGKGDFSKVRLSTPIIIVELTTCTEMHSKGRETRKNNPRLLGMVRGTK